jgi:uncharacterized protein (DUF433 family)
MRESSICYERLLSIDPLVRQGQICIEGTCITLGDVLGWLSEGCSIDRLLIDHPELSRDAVLSCLSYASDVENRVIQPW